MSSGIQRETGGGRSAPAKVGTTAPPDIDRIADHGLFRAYPDGLALVSLTDRQVLAVNPALDALLGLDAPSHTGKASSVLFRLVEKAIGCGDSTERTAGQGDAGRTCEVDTVGPDGQTRTLSVRLASAPQAPDAPDGPCRAWLLVQDVSAIREETARLKHDAGHDVLTDLPNRRSFSEALARHYDDAVISGTTGALIVIDLDRLKTVNDTQGHQSGDGLLVTLSARLRATLRAGEFAARLGGDEFAVILPRIGSGRTAKRRALDIGASLNLSVGGMVSSASIGVSLFPNDAKTAEGVLRRADAAMYASKRAGGGIVTFHRPDLPDSPASATAEALADLSLAANSGDLHLALQPIVTLAGSDVVMYEALLRWSRDGHEVRLPATFLKLAEVTSGADILRRFTVERALALQDSLTRGGSNVPISVNLSPAQIATDQALDWLLETLVASGKTDAIVFEITETTAFRDDAQFARLCRLRDAGVRLAIDDFGVGHATLSYLARIPADFLKLDKSFVTAIGQPRNDAVLRAAVALGHACGMQIIAEGVETDDQARFLGDCGCDMAQGYLFGAPRRI